MAAARILVADDDPVNLRMVTAVLEKSGYEVETAVDGEEAYEKAIANPPDLLITDVMMPKLDGWDLVKSLRSHPGFAFVPVIFLTSLVSDDDRIRGFRLGADDYLPKPFRCEELDLRVARTLRRGHVVEEQARHQIAPEEGAKDGAGIAGEIGQVGLSALLTLLEMEGKSGLLAVTNAATSRIGRVFLSKGRVVRARLGYAGAPANEECVYHMLGWVAGSFEFSATEVQVEDEVQASTVHLLIEGARRLDEARRDEAAS